MSGADEQRERGKGGREEGKEEGKIPGRLDTQIQSLTQGLDPMTMRIMTSAEIKIWMLHLLRHAGVSTFFCCKTKFSRKCGLSISSD